MPIRAVGCPDCSRRGARRRANSHDDYDADLGLERGRVREAIGIKLTSGPTPKDLARLNSVGDFIEANQRVLVCRVRQSVTTGRHWVANLADYLRT